MPARKKPPDAVPDDSKAQRERASELRDLIRELAQGKRPAGQPAPTPREFTDDAARRKLAAAKKRRKG